LSRARSLTDALTMHLVVARLIVTGIEISKRAASSWLHRSCGIDKVGLLKVRKYLLKMGKEQQRLMKVKRGFDCVTLREKE